MPFSLTPIAPTAVVSRNGVPLLIRRLEPADAPLLVAMFDHLSLRSRYLRFMTPLTNVSREEVLAYVARVTTFDPYYEEALVALLAGTAGPEAIGVARFVQQPARLQHAEAALVVRDDFQGLGVGRLLFDLLAAAARARAVTTFTAVTLAENRVVVEALRRTGLPFHTHTHHGETTIEIQL